MRRTQTAIPNVPPALDILHAQWPEGYWVAPGFGYSPRYRATVWQLLFLAQLGAPSTGPILRACEYVLTHAQASDGRFAAGRGRHSAPLCLNGNLLRALCWFGLKSDPRVQAAARALARQITHAPMCCRFPGCEFARGARPGGLLCIWGITKAGLGLLAVGTQDKEIAAALRAVRKLLCGSEPSLLEPDETWWQFGFPLGETGDALEILLLLQSLGCRDDPRVQAITRAVMAKRDGDGRWALERTLHRTWADFGRVGMLNKWVTLRALWALRPTAFSTLFG
ncbi:MAG: hypothetical protein J7M34_08270 [Anaerolineae bacterium]|nr:hypothetical protein [Anaerolineae bacterium]